MKEWPGQQLQLKGIQAARDSKIQLLGYGKPMEWVNSEGGTLVKLPNQLQDAGNRPCEHAWVLKIQLDTHHKNSLK
jgi:hypothetical protein